MSLSQRYRCRLVVVAFVLTLAACASTGWQDRQVDQALSLCRQLAGPDAVKAGGEAWFWLQSERVEASRKLWNLRGTRAIDRRLAATMDEVTRNCLKQLQQEAATRQIVR